MGTPRATRFLIPLTAAIALSACEDGKGPNFQFLQKKPAAEGADATPEVTRNPSSVKLIERDVEAPDVFQKTGDALWDGRPSLGGVWIAHKDVKQPERVMIRNETNGKTVIGALFQRERITPGPEMQLSSDAADALVAVAGAPVKISVVALRKEEAPENPVAEMADADGEQTLPAASAITATSLDAPADSAKPETQSKDVKLASAAATPAKPTKAIAIEDPVLGSKLPKKTGGKVEGIAAAAQKAIARGTTPAKPIKASARASGGISKPFIQIGIFSVKSNADNTATSLRNIGIVPTVREQTSKGKVFWRVVVGPASSGSERSTLLKKVKELGFNDAYFVTN